MPVVITDCEGKILFSVPAAKRWGFTVGSTICVPADGEEDCTSAWSQNRHAHLQPVTAKAGGPVYRALLGFRRIGTEERAIWIFPACLQISNLNILAPTVTQIYLSVGEEVVDFLYDRYCGGEYAEDRIEEGNTCGRVSASTRRVAQINGYMAQIAARLVQRESGNANGIRYPMHRILALFRLMTSEAYSKCGYHVTMDDLELSHTPDAVVPFWPLAVTATAMIVFVLEISAQRSAGISYYMDELAFVFEVKATVPTDLPPVKNSHAFARLGTRYADLYPEFLFAVRLLEAGGGSMSYSVNTAQENNFKLSLSIELPDPFLCFLHMPAAEPDYDAEFSELLNLLFFGSGIVE